MQNNGNPKPSMWEMSDRYVFSRALGCLALLLAGYVGTLTPWEWVGSWAALVALGGGLFGCLVFPVALARFFNWWHTRGYHVR